MAQAGTNFNHLVQSKKKEGHVLVTNGIYGWLRHPSYFGFFWWGLGTQLITGNLVCLVGYAVVLWRFFSLRIKKSTRCGPFFGIFWYLAMPSFPEALQDAVVFFEVFAAAQGS
ncbi:MAG: hypothetical protein L6R42_001666 [Xanthoria sp. 1 TBL-2021]|nr:MAG: hypothetical protein L6R42_001666 [Xanthoria sp. 1 TBL-2021]